MFTGLVETTTAVLQNQAHNLVLARPQDYEALEGDSVAVNGCCLTVCASSSLETLVFDVSPESLEKTSLGDVSAGGLVHLERALKLGDRLGGHWVSGHVDDCGHVLSVNPVGDFTEIRLEIPEHLKQYVIEKGSICLDGVSLTINKVIGEREISLMLIPATLQTTHFDMAKPGQRINLEVDILGKYVEKLMSLGREINLRAPE